MEIIEKLTTEHGAILKGLASLSEAKDALEKNRRPPKAFFDAAVVFFKEYADRFHHYKEEYILFSLLARKKEGDIDLEMGALRYQHELNRKCIAKIESALHGYETGNEIAAQTNIGIKRKTNQDRYAMTCFTDNTILMAIADGLGGEPGGEIASDYVIEELIQLTGPNYSKAIENQALFFKKLDQKLCVMTEKNHELSGMATTLISIFIQNNVACWCHSGDSRLYHVRNDRIRQITKDQTLARFLMQEGELTKEQSNDHYSKNVIDQCIGCQDLTPETGQIYLESNDMLILATDGLYRSVSEEEIHQVVCKSSELVQVVDVLVNLSLNAGGKDNITVVIGKIH
ncbi:MAG: protein phosphatase 2C domain-containing protein [Proteobacteria bacterium]|nr:protein phosphatase 2C domain-containing protein [Pseudomonadota bacterium]MBU1542418.1 protein phosphatase 2C domain-containing protein [Pseudomonadota bacterium]MBU2482794.1 protein phosphatase 2C domain-containing protein [Pseudomonadota bacterium]